MKNKTEKSSNFLLLGLLMLSASFLINCTGGSSGGSGGGSAASSSASGGGSSPITTPAPAPTPTPNPSAGDCSEASIAAQINTSVTNHIVSQDEIAKACVDSVTDYETNIHFPPTNIFQTVRFQTTCASRWCDLHFSSTAGVGVTKSEMAWVGDTLDVGALVSVQCRSVKAELINDVCADHSVIQTPLESFTLNYNDAQCGFCGCDPGTVGSKWSQSQQALIDCGTNYCKAQNAGFYWGILSEVNSSAYVIRCSRATVQ